MSKPHELTPQGIDRPGAVPAESGPAASPHSALALLLRDIAACRESIQRRDTALSDLRARLHAELGPLEAQLVKARVETLRVLGRHLQDGWLRKREASRLLDALREFADELENDFGADLREERRTLLDQDPGPEAGGGDSEEDGSGRFEDDSSGDYAGEAGNGGAGGGASGNDADGARQGNTKGTYGHRPGKAARQRKAKEEALAGDIRALYLLLARALHPDKEQDPARREEKTAWMKKVTTAYGSRDLAALLDILGRNPLDAVGPYLSQAPAKTVQGFAKRLRRELALLRKQAEEGGNINPFFNRFLTPKGINEVAFKGHLATLKKDVKFMRQRLELYRNREAIEELVEMLGQHEWRELM